MRMWEVTNTGTFCQDGKSKICQKGSSKVAKAGKPGAIEDAKAEALLELKWSCEINGLWLPFAQRWLLTELRVVTVFRTPEVSLQS